LQRFLTTNSQQSSYPVAKNRSHQRKAPEICPVCGEDVPRGSLACPECGADHKSGWREDGMTYDDVSLPDDDFNYEEFVREEFGPASRPTGVKAVWWITAILLIGAFLALYFYVRH
jgi:hypothetical protein